MVENKTPIDSRETVKYGQNDDGNEGDTDVLPKEGHSSIMDGVDVILTEESVKEYKEALKELNRNLEKL